MDREILINNFNSSKCASAKNIPLLSVNKAVGHQVCGIAQIYTTCSRRYLAVNMTLDNSLQPSPKLRRNKNYHVRSQVLLAPTLTLT